MTGQRRVAFGDGRNGDHDGWSAFDWLIAPMERTVFLRDVWEQAPAAIRRDDRTYFSCLVTSADVDTIATMFRLAPVQEDQRTQTVRLVRLRDGRPSSEPVVAGHDGTPDVHHLYRAYTAGSTVIIGPLGHRWAPVASLCGHLEAALHHRVSANLYLTPADAQGFPPHHDTHDVFIVQVEGSKSWRVYEPRRHLPLVDAPWFDVTPSAEGAQDVELHAGDVLYMPRGWMHEARTSAVPSLHITLGVHVVRWADLVGDVVTAAAERACAGSLVATTTSASRYPDGISATRRSSSRRCGSSRRRASSRRAPCLVG